MPLSKHICEFFSHKVAFLLYLVWCVDLSRDKFPNARMQQGPAFYTYLHNIGRANAFSDSLRYVYTRSSPLSLYLLSTGCGCGLTRTPALQVFPRTTTRFLDSHSSKCVHTYIHTCTYNVHAYNVHAYMYIRWNI